MSRSESGKSLSPRASSKIYRMLSLPAARQFCGIVISKIGGKAHLVRSKLSERRWRTTAGSGSSWGSDDSTACDGSQASYTPKSSIASIPKWDPLDIPPPLPEPIILPTVSFSTPLPPPESLNSDWLEIDVHRHQFLLSFLHQERYMDIPFGIAHRLINYIMHLAEEAAYDFVKLHRPDSMEIELEGGERKWVKRADDVEIHYWVRYIRKNSGHLHKHMAGYGICNELKQLRLHAVHGWVYDTYQIKAAVAFIAMLRDEPRITALEQVLRVIYLTQQEASQPIVTDAERHLADVALGYIPTEPRTVHQVLCRAQELLEHTCYNYWAKHSPQRLADEKWPCDTLTDSYSPYNDKYGWDCAERVELNRWSLIEWNFPAFAPGPEFSDPTEDDAKYIERLLGSAACLRHAAAHRRIVIKELTVAGMLEEAQWLAEALDDDAAAAEMYRLREHECWGHIRAEQAEATAKWKKTQKDCAEEERVAWQHEVLGQILEGSLLVREGLLGCETPVDECGDASTVSCA